MERSLPGAKVRGNESYFILFYLEFILLWIVTQLYFTFKYHF